MKEGKISTEAKVGILVLLGIILLFVMSFRVSRVERMKGEVYTALFPSVSGLVINAAVEVAGVTVGKVEKIGLEKGKGKVWMRIGQVEMHQDAEAIIKTHGVLGDKYIEIKPGSPEAPLLPPGGTITRVTSAPDMDQLFTSLESATRGIGELGESLREIVGDEESKKAIKELIVNIRDASSGFKEIIGDNREKVNTIVANLEEFSRGLTPLSQKAERTLTNLDQMSTKVRAGEGTLGKLLNDDALYNEAKETMASFRRVVAKVENGEGSLGKFVTDERLYADAKETMASFRRVMAKVEKGEGSLGKLMSDETLYQEATKTMKKVQKASEGLQEQYPITALSTILGLFF
ncbi:MAG: MCE family protein [Deltaproteobacteria bacterium]|nr:MAG: MCE family protein [Deltaproteobacteria bacterium]